MASVKRRKRKEQLTSTNISMDPNSNRHRSKIFHPGVPPQCIDIYGNPSTVSLVRIARLAHQVATTWPGEDGRCFLDTDKLKAYDGGRLTFVVASLYTIDSSAYRSDMKKYPLTITLELGHIGRTSLCIVTNIFLPSGDVMFTAHNQLILIDPRTRHSTPIPDFWREEFSPVCVLERPLRVPKQFPDNANIFSEDLQDCRLIVAWSDVDNNDHANFTSYIRFAIDAVYPSARKGHLAPHLEEENLKSGVEEVKVIYLGETGEGEMVYVKLLRPLPEVPRAVLCYMTTEAGRPVCEVTLTFHPKVPRNQSTSL